MKRFGLPQCPYCEKKVNPLYAWYLRTQGEYICPKCGGVSNIVLDPLVKVIGVAAILLGVVFFIVAMVDQTDAIPVKYALLIAAPFVLFSIVSAFFVHLKRPVLRKREPARPQGAAQGRSASQQNRPAAQGRSASQQNRPAAQGRPASQQGRPVSQQGRPVPQGARRQAPAGQAAPQRTPLFQQKSNTFPQESGTFPRESRVYGGRRTASGAAGQVTPQSAAPSAPQTGAPRTSPAQERPSPPYDGHNA